MTIRAFMDASCPECHTHIGWLGSLSDKPPCPNCGHQDSPEALDAVAVTLNAARVKVNARIAKEHREQWRNPTPAQLKAFAEGRRECCACENRDAPLEASGASPYTLRNTGKLFDADPLQLHHWFMDGWHEEADWWHRQKGDS